MNPALWLHPCHFSQDTVTIDIDGEAIGPNPSLQMGVNTGAHAEEPESTVEHCTTLSHLHAGVYLVRSNVNTTKLMQAWRTNLTEHNFENVHDQTMFYRFMRQRPGEPIQRADRLKRIVRMFNDSVPIAVMPASLFMNFHTYFVQGHQKVSQSSPPTLHDFCDTKQGSSPVAC